MQVRRCRRRPPWFRPRRRPTSCRDRNRRRRHPAIRPIGRPLVAAGAYKPLAAPRTPGGPRPSAARTTIGGASPLESAILAAREGRRTPPPDDLVLAAVLVFVELLPRIERVLPDEL